MKYFLCLLQTSIVSSYRAKRAHQRDREVPLQLGWSDAYSLLRWQTRGGEWRSGNLLQWAPCCGVWEVLLEMSHHSFRNIGCVWTEDVSLTSAGCSEAALRDEENFSLQNRSTLDRQTMLAGLKTKSPVAGNEKAFKTKCWPLGRISERCLGSKPKSYLRILTSTVG